MASPGDLERTGLDAFRQGDLGAAVEAFAEAEAAYRSAGEPARAAEMANNRCVALVGLGRGPEAVEAVRGTIEVFADAGEPLNRARAVGNLAAALDASGDLVEAAQHYREAIRLLNELGDRQAEAETWQALSRLQLRSGDPLAAAASAETALGARPRPGFLRRILGGLLRRLLRLPGA